MNCCALLYFSFYLFQDILTNEIISRGTKRDGLFYMDDFTFGQANTTRQAGDEERQIWLWHCRLGHSSFSYLWHLFLSLFSNLHKSDFKCETCIRAKSHCVSYPISLKNYETTPIPVLSSFRWFVIFVDDYTCMTWLYFMKNKTEVFGMFSFFL